MKGTSTVLADEMCFSYGGFWWILSLRVRPQIDLFAIKENYKLRLYVSPILD